MVFTDAKAPLIIGIGAGAWNGSSTDQALALALAEAKCRGARTLMFGCQELSQLPLYLTPEANASPYSKALISAVRAADGLIIASPGYHGTLSGKVKNAIDYIEDTAKDPRPYLTDLPVGLIAVAAGHQAAVSTLATLRTIAHALRAWPTPFGATINSSGGIFRDGVCTDEASNRHLQLVGMQVCERAWERSASDETFAIDLSHWR